MKQKLQNVLLLATEHNITPAYINKLAQLGMRPSKVLLLNWRNSNYSNSIDGLSQHEFLTIMSSIKNTLKAEGVYAGDLSRSTEATLNEVNWDYEQVDIDHINSERFISFLSNSIQEKYIVFCGGGILRENILNCGKQFIHVHPGVVPGMRGADCLLWSALVENRIGMSAFFMNEGVDTGDIIARLSFAIPHFDISVSKFDSETVKDLLVNYVDPHYRAFTLAAIFESKANPVQWETEKQHLSEGKTYYFMHKALLPQAINKFCKSEMKMVS